MLPSWIRSRNCSPRLVYFLAIDTTRRRLASTSSDLARSAMRSPSWRSRNVERSSGAAPRASSSITVTLRIAVLICSSISSKSAIVIIVRLPTARARRAHLAQRLADLVGRHPGLGLALADLELGLVELDDDVLELGDDAVDRGLVEPQVRELLEHLGAVGLDQLLDLALLALGVRLHQLLFELLGVALELADLVDDLADPVDVELLVELGLVLVDVLDDVLDPDLAAAQPLADLEQLLDGDRAVEHGLQHLALAVLDALGDLDLALAGEQGDRAHLAQVHADRVAGPRVGVLLSLIH